DAICAVYPYTTLFRSDLAGHAVEGRLVELALRIGLLGLVFGTIKVAHDLGNRDQIPRIDLGIIFLRAARPHGALDPRPPLNYAQDRKSTRLNSSHVKI